MVFDGYFVVFLENGVFLFLSDKGKKRRYFFRNGLRLVYCWFG